MSNGKLAFVLVLTLVSLSVPAFTVENVSAWWWPYYSYYYYYDYGYYYTQYTLTINTNPVGLSNAVAGGGTYRYYSMASFTANEVVSGDPGVRYVFTGWSGDGSGSSSSGSVRMDGSKTITANYKTQYYLKVAVNPSGLVSMTGEGWYDAGTKADIGGAPSPIGDAGRRQVFAGWSVDGSQTQGNPISAVMDRSHVATATYKQQYYLKVNSPLGVVQGEGWYDAGSTATVSAPGPMSAGGLIGALGGKFVFDGWGGDMTGSSQTMTMTMDGPHVIVATWATDYTMVYLSLIFLSGLTFLVGIFVSRRLAGTRFPRIPLASRITRRPGSEAHAHGRRVRHAAKSSSPTS